MSYNLPRLNLSDPQIRNIYQSLSGLLQGKTNNTGSFTCTQNQATTVVTDPRCGAESTVVYTPATANASAEVGAGTIYIGTYSDGSFTVTHANSATASRTFDYIIVG